MARPAALVTLAYVAAALAVEIQPNSHMAEEHDGSGMGWTCKDGQQEAAASLNTSRADELRRDEIVLPCLR